MPKTLILLAVATAAQGAGLVDAHVQRAQELVAKHRGSVGRLAAPATAAAQALLVGGANYIGNNGVPAFFYEGLGRAGGVMPMQVFQNGSDLKPGDLLWLSYNAKTYQSALRLSADLEQKKAIVIMLGPQPPSGRPPFTHWIDSLTAWDDDDNFVLMGNVLSMWCLTGEIAAATARQGKTLVFWQSVLVPGSRTRNARYKDLLFHDGLPQMAPVEAGTLSAAYLDRVAAMLTRIADSELEKIMATGREMGRRAAAGTPVALLTTSHLIPKIAELETNWFEFVSDSNRLEKALARAGSLVYLGYTGVDLEVWRTVRRAGVNAVWISGELPNQTDFEYFGDTVIDEHWRLGDSAVKVPGYDVRILPVSGIAQLFIYDLLLRAAQEE